MVIYARWLQRDVASKILLWLLLPFLSPTCGFFSLWPAKNWHLVLSFVLLRCITCADTCFILLPLQRFNFYFEVERSRSDSLHPVMDKLWAHLSEVRGQGYPGCFLKWMYNRDSKGNYQSTIDTWAMGKYSHHISIYSEAFFHKNNIYNSCRFLK